MPVEHKVPLSYPFKFFLATTAGIVAETNTYPLDYLKTQYQIQGQAKCDVNSGKNKRLYKIAIKRVTKHGVPSLYTGWSGAVLRVPLSAGTRIPLYETGKNYMEKKTGRRLNLLESCLMAGISGGTAQFVANPADLIKIRLQTGNVESMTQAIQEFPSLRASLLGSKPAIQRSIVIAVGDLTTYDQSKQFFLTNGIMEEGHKLHVSCSFISGLVCTLISMPFDLCKTRIMYQPVDHNGKGLFYRGVFHCMKNTVKNEGMRTLYKGFMPAWARNAIWSQIFWNINESLRLHVFNTKSF